MAWLDLTWPDVAGRGRSSCVTWRSMCRSKVFKWSKPGHWLTQTVKRSVYLQLTVFVDHIALLPQMRGCLLGMGTGGGREWRLDHEYHPKKTGETVDRRQNNRSVKECPLAIAQRLVHCAIAVSTAVLGRVTRTMSVALLLRNSPKRKKSNSHSPAPPPCSWSHLEPCKIGFCFSTKSLSVSPLCSSERLEWMCRSVSVMYWSFDGDDVFFFCSILFKYVLMYWAVLMGIITSLLILFNSLFDCECDVSMGTIIFFVMCVSVMYQWGQSFFLLCVSVWCINRDNHFWGVMCVSVMYQ